MPFIFHFAVLDYLMNFTQPKSPRQAQSSHLKNSNVSVQNNDQTELI